MDPDQTLKDLIDALRRGDREEAAGCAGYLTTWLRRQGFEPKLQRAEMVSLFAALETFLTIGDAA